MAVGRRIRPDALDANAKHVPANKCRRAAPMRGIGIVFRSVRAPAKAAESYLDVETVSVPRKNPVQPARMTVLAKAMIFVSRTNAVPRAAARMCVEATAVEDPAETAFRANTVSRANASLGIVRPQAASPVAERYRFNCQQKTETSRSMVVASQNLLGLKRL